MPSSSLLSTRPRLILDDGVPLHNRFGIAELSALQSFLHSGPEDRSESSASPESQRSRKTVGERTENVTLDVWTEAIATVFHTKELASDAEEMFAEMTKSKEDPLITWRDLLDYLMDRMKPSCLKSDLRYLSHNQKFRPIQHSRRESIQKIIGVSSGPTYVYIIVSKYGKVGIYDEKLRLQRRYDVDIDTDPNADLDVAASDPGWITDGLWMDNSKHAVYSTSLRTMHFYDASASVHYEEYRAFGFKSIPTCLAYHFSDDQPEQESLLLFGDDAGGLTWVTFHQPLNSLFSKDEVDGVQCLFWPDVTKHAEYASVAHLPDVHGDGVLGIRYLHHNRTVITISRDPNASVSIRQLDGKFGTYVFKLASWGVRCFDYHSEIANPILATGSNDKLVRLWHPVVTARPSATLVGHRAGICDVRILAQRDLVVSYDKDATVKVWSLERGSCCQTLSLAFPSFAKLGKEIEFGRPALYVETSSPYLFLVTCCEHLAKLSVESGEDTDSVHSTVPSDDEEANDTIELTSQPRSRRSKRDTELNEAFFMRRRSGGQDGKGSFLASPNRLSRAQSPAAFETDSNPSSGGWSVVRNVIDYRVKGKIFQKGELEDDLEYASFRYFKENHEAIERDDSINILKVNKYSNTDRLEELARSNMPFMGLEIHGLKEIRLEPNLPHTASMRQRGIHISTVKDVINAKFESTKIKQSGASRNRSAEVTPVGSRRASEIFNTKAKKDLAVPGGSRKGSISGGSTNGKGLPMISEKSDTQSVISTDL